ncbi:MAG: AAA family ATPase, partial [Nitrospirae bacterium]
MYKRFFDLTERPFKLVPNPAYLFLSRGHEEALAHLTYALSEGDGFVAITGEVGTGKTLLCRAFLEGLGDDVSVAYIFNPRLDGLELLRAIRDELGFEAPGESAQELIDGLNRFLIEERRAGRKVLLLIDEAQNLSPEVLEQLRLLSNLETRDAKLIQIVLVGQPELAEMLDTYELRQLAQRITLSCVLSPLDRRDARRYVEHRLRVASRGRPVPFTRGAHRVLYRYSGGVPRLLNIAADRALLAAYVAGRRRISGRLARRAVRELAAMGE